MSQYPPPPYQPQQQGYPPQGGYPPPGYPPQGSYPPPGGNFGMPGGMPPPAAGNGWGTASLITGLVSFCVPLGGLLAILFGFIGIGRARKTGSGKGLAVVGILFGLLSIALHAALAGAGWKWAQATKPNRDLAKQFITDLHAGDLAAARAQTDGSVPLAELKTASERLIAFGPIADTTSIPVPQNGDVMVVTTVTSNSGQIQYQMVQTNSNGIWKVTSFGVNGGPAVRGATATTIPSGQPE